MPLLPDPFDVLLRRANTQALAAFRASARKAKPTRQHRAGLWECMLGTVYAMNAAGEVRYFDYDYAAAVQHIGPVTDVRVARHNSWQYRTGAASTADTYQLPRDGKLVWYVRDHP